jgi:hypothetical protein
MGKAIIVVRGGLVNSVYSEDPSLQVIIYDLDAREEDDPEENSFLDGFEEAIKGMKEVF